MAVIQDARLARSGRVAQTGTLPPDIHADSAALAQRAAAGDRSALRSLFQTLRGRLHGTLYRVLGSNEHMEDLLQETCIEVFRSLGSYRGEAQLTTWADRIAVRVAYRYLRNAPRKGLVPAAAVGLCLVSSPEDNALHREGVRRLYAALASLKPQYRIAFVLFTVDGRSLQEVAEVTGTSRIAVKSRVWRARRLLRAAAEADAVLAAYLGEPGEESCSDE